MVWGGLNALRTDWTAKVLYGICYIDRLHWHYHQTCTPRVSWARGQKPYMAARQCTVPHKPSSGGISVRTNRWAINVACTKPGSQYHRKRVDILFHRSVVEVWTFMSRNLWRQKGIVNVVQGHVVVSRSRVTEGNSRRIPCPHWRQPAEQIARVPLPQRWFHEILICWHIFEVTVHWWFEIFAIQPPVGITNLDPKKGISLFCLDIMLCFLVYWLSWV